MIGGPLAHRVLVQGEAVKERIPLTHPHRTRLALHLSFAAQVERSVS
jgi:hypothetical protein